MKRAGRHPRVEATGRGWTSARGWAEKPYKARDGRMFLRARKAKVVTWYEVTEDEVRHLREQALAAKRRDIVEPT